ncbi:three component ABC system middle component [Undibacterium pigrum]|uniref:Uncharacterized protein n=1 Tax=Undibacterium pigrum TaxID=401470 RepID=A0A318JHT4_9BURK|nr:three component ABC system middle component [Undibacterium pigrum]PXX43218.1 hypothetical protein DFR42_104219 [Undibacterium pigrum]
MILAHDMFAETNPAFCAVVLAAFCKSYQSLNDQAPTLLLAYPVLPIVMSNDLTDTFAGTNKSTGMLEWIHRNPQILIGIAKRVNATLPLTTDAIQFGCLIQLLKVNNDGSISSTNKSIPKAAIQSSIESNLKKARLIGSWFAGIGSARAVMEALGVSI